MNLKELKKSLESDAGRAVKQFLASHYARLSHLDSVREYDGAEEQATEIKAQKKAVQLLKEILGQIMDIEMAETSSRSEEY